MKTSGVSFGTSGARGLASAITAQVSAAYTLAFLGHIEATQPGEKRVALAGDLRESTFDILQWCMGAAENAGWKVELCGFIPSPALALYGIQENIPSIMVTGSHIPEDRNGIKFNRRDGEITKTDEAAIRAQTVTVGKNLLPQQELVEYISFGAINAYQKYFTKKFPKQPLTDLRVGFYQHSAAGRELLPPILEKLGAEVSKLSPSQVFVPVDTEAIRKEDIAFAKRKMKTGKFDCLVSTDGDSDRPLLAGEDGKWLRGDVLGILAAKALGIQAIALPVSCNTAAEKSGFFKEVLRTKIGSPYVIEGMQALEKKYKKVAGFEANGGFLTTTLPTRDALTPVVAVLSHAKKKQKKVTELVSELPQRFTCSDRVKDFPATLAKKKIEAARKEFLASDRPGNACDTTDGLRMTFSNGNIVHLRASGNAPEIRCYTEAASEKEAKAICASWIREFEEWKK
jgi:phosphomannomutase